MQPSELQAFYQDQDQITKKRIERAAKAAGISVEALTEQALRRGVLSKTDTSERLSQILCASSGGAL